MKLDVQVASKKMAYTFMVHEFRGEGFIEIQPQQLFRRWRPPVEGDFISHISGLVLFRERNRKVDR